jgi:two-component system nitrate/nitrite response regulator NarL
VNSEGSTTRVAIVDPHVLFAECLEVALNLRGYQTHRIPVPDSPQTYTPLVAAIRHARPAVVIINLDLGEGKDGCNLIEPVVASGAAVIGVTGSSDRSRWGECLVRGACTVVSQEVPLSAVTSAIRRIRGGSRVMPREEFLGLVRRFHEGDRGRREVRARLERLTPREGEILGSLMAGRSVSYIARTRFLAESTVRTQVKSILAKLEVSSQIAAVGLAHQAQWRVTEWSAGAQAV